MTLREIIERHDAPSTASISCPTEPHTAADVRDVVLTQRGYAVAAGYRFVAALRHLDQDDRKLVVELLFSEIAES